MGATDTFSKPVNYEEVIMNDLIVLVVSIVTTIGLAILILALSEVVFNAIPRWIMPTRKNDGIQLKQRENKTGSCPFC